MSRKKQRQKRPTARVRTTGMQKLQAWPGGTRRTPPQMVNIAIVHAYAT
jgi:hypothetical protein